MMDYFFCAESPTRAISSALYYLQEFLLKKNKKKTKKTGSFRKQPLLAQQSSISVRYAEPSWSGIGCKERRMSRSRLERIG